MLARTALAAPLLTLFLAAPVGAAQYSVCDTEAKTCRYFTYTELRVWLGLPVNDDTYCRVKLEAAMRKMEPLIFKTVVPSAIWHNAPAYKDAWELWDAAKACWKETP